MNAFRLRAVLALSMTVSAAWPGRLEGQTFEAVHVFGDNLTAVTGGPYFQGRWCNGPVWPEYLAGRLNVSNQSRNNHAQGLATSVTVLNQAQVVSAIDSESTLGVVFAGTLDFGSRFGPDPVAGTWMFLSDQVLLNSSNIVVTLSAKGFRSIAILNQPDLMRFPQFSSLSTKDKAFFRQRTMEFNNNLRSAISQIAAARTNLSIVLIDVFALFDMVLNQPDSFGFTVTTIGAIHDPRLTNKAYDGPGRNYFFWDLSSVTSRVHNMIADWVYAALHGTSLSLQRTEEGWILSVQEFLVGKSYLLQASTDARFWVNIDSDQARFFNGDLLLPAAASNSPVELFRLQYLDNPNPF